MSKIAIYAIGVGLLLAGLVWGIVAYGDRQYAAGQQAQIAAQAESDRQAKSAEDTKQKDAHTASQAAVSTGEATQAATADNTQTVVRTVTRIVHDKPSPVTCVLPDDSLHELTAAALRANAAADRVSGTQAISQDTLAGPAKP